MSGGPAWQPRNDRLCSVAAEPPTWEEGPEPSEIFSTARHLGGWIGRCLAGGRQVATQRQVGSPQQVEVQWLYLLHPINRTRS